MFKIVIMFLLILTNLFAYQGEGEEKNRQEAIYSALSDIASQISISVDSTTIIDKIATNDNYSREVQNLIRVEIPKISFQNYHILEIKRKDKGYFVRLEIDQKSLVATHIQKLERELDELSQQVDSYSSKFKKYTLLKKSKIKKLFLSLELIHAIDSTYNLDSYQNKIKSFSRERNACIKALSFQIQSNNQQVKDMASSLLSRMGLIGSSNGEIELKVNLGEIEKTKISNQYIGTTTATIEMIENQESVFSKSIKLTGTSLISEHYLIKKILKQLEERLNNTFVKIIS